MNQLHPNPIVDRQPSWAERTVSARRPPTPIGMAAIGVRRNAQSEEQRRKEQYSQELLRQINENAARRGKLATPPQYFHKHYESGKHAGIVNNQTESVHQTKEKSRPPSRSTVRPPSSRAARDAVTELIATNAEEPLFVAPNHLNTALIAVKDTEIVPAYTNSGVVKADQNKDMEKLMAEFRAMQRYYQEEQRREQERNIQSAPMTFYQDILNSWRTDAWRREREYASERELFQRREELSRMLELERVRERQRIQKETKKYYPPRSSPHSLTSLPSLTSSQSAPTIELLSSRSLPDEKITSSRSSGSNSRTQFSRYSDNSKPLASANTNKPEPITHISNSSFGNSVSSNQDDERKRKQEAYRLELLQQMKEKDERQKNDREKKKLQELQEEEKNESYFHFEGEKTSRRSRRATVGSSNGQEPPRAIEQNSLNSQAAPGSRRRSLGLQEGATSTANPPLPSEYLSSASAVPSKNGFSRFSPKTDWEQAEIQERQKKKAEYENALREQVDAKKRAQEEGKRLAKEEEKAEEERIEKERLALGQKHSLEHSSEHPTSEQPQKDNQNHNSQVPVSSQQLKSGDLETEYEKEQRMKGISHKNSLKSLALTASEYSAPSRAFDTKNEKHRELASYSSAPTNPTLATIPPVTHYLPHPSLSSAVPSVPLLPPVMPQYYPTFAPSNYTPMILQPPIPSNTFNPYPIYPDPNQQAYLSMLKHQNETHFPQTFPSQQCNDNRPPMRFTSALHPTLLPSSSASTLPEKSTLVSEHDDVYEIMSRNIHTAAGGQDRNSQWQNYWKETKKEEFQANDYNLRPYSYESSYQSGNHSNNPQTWDEEKHMSRNLSDEVSLDQINESFDQNPYMISLSTARSGRSVNLMHSGDQRRLTNEYSESPELGFDADHDDHHHELEGELVELQSSEEFYFPVEHVDGDELQYNEENEAEGEYEDNYEEYNDNDDQDNDSGASSARSSVIAAFLSKQNTT